MDSEHALCVADILGPEGSIARRLPHYELRPQQLDMADAVAKATANAGAELSSVNSDLHAGEDYRRAMVGVFARRALLAAIARA